MFVVKKLEDEKNTFAVRKVGKLDLLLLMLNKIQSKL